MPGDTYVCAVVSRSVMSDSVAPWTAACQAPVSKGILQNPGVGCHALLQGIFLTQWTTPGLLHCREIIYHLSMWSLLIMGQFFLPWHTPGSMEKKLILWVTSEAPSKLVSPVLLLPSVPELRLETIGSKFLNK